MEEKIAAKYEGKVVILGTPHGENVAGKRSPDGRFREYRFGREVIRELKLKLEREGVMVVVDIPGDVVPSKQEDELRMRCGIVNSLCERWGTKNCCYVSVHVNASGMGKQWMMARGWCVFTSVGRTRADGLASCLWDAAREVLPQDHKTAVRADWSDKDPDYEKDLYVLKKTRCAAVLTENLFMDNLEDLEYLESIEGRMAIVELHRRGIMRWLDEQ